MYSQMEPEFKRSSLSAAGVSLHPFNRHLAADAEEVTEVIPIMSSAEPDGMLAEALQSPSALGNPFQALDDLLPQAGIVHAARSLLASYLKASRSADRSSDTQHG